MNVLNFSLKMLERKYKASLIYGMILLFAITAIFVFSEIGANTNISIDSSLFGFSLSLSTLMPSFIVFFCLIVVIYATNYYFSYKGKEFSLLYLSGASMTAKIKYIVYQILVIMLLVVPFSIAIGYGIVTLLYQTVFASLYPVVYIDSFISTAFSLIVVIMVISICTMGYVHRTSILDLQKGRKSVRLYTYKKSLFKILISIIGYIYSIYAASIMHVEGIITILSGYVLISAICILSLYGMFRLTIPRLVRLLKKKRFIKNSCLFVGASYYLSAIKNNLVIVTFLLAIPTIFAPSLASQNSVGPEYKVTLIGYVFLIVLCNIVLICKYLNHTVTRYRDYKMLSNIGYTRLQMKTILKQEIGLIYVSILLFPLPLVVVISYRYIELYNQSFAIFVTIISLYIIPIMISMITTYVIQYQTLIKKEDL